jgi:hypothetical protein
MILFKVKDGASQFQNFRVNFHSSLHDHHRLCARWVPKMLTGAHKTQRMASDLWKILERYNINGDEFLNQILRVAGDETCISLVNVETEDQ